MYNLTIFYKYVDAAYKHFFLLILFAVIQHGSAEKLQIILLIYLVSVSK